MKLVFTKEGELEAVLTGLLIAHKAKFYITVHLINCLYLIKKCQEARADNEVLALAARNKAIKMDDENVIYKDEVDFKYTIRRILSEDLISSGIKENMKQDTNLETDDALYAQVLMLSDKYLVYQYQKAVPIDFTADITLQYTRSVTPCLQKIQEKVEMILNAKKNSELLVKHYNPDIRKRLGDSDDESSDDLDSSVDEEAAKPKLGLFTQLKTGLKAGLQMDDDPDAKSAAALKEEKL